MNIVTLTLNPTVDRSCFGPRVVPEDKLRCSEPRSEPGGGGINVARALHELGAEPRAVYACGGLAGERLRRMLEAAGIVQSPVPIAGETRQNLTVFERDADRAYRFVMPGPTLSPGELECCTESVFGAGAAPDLLVASGSLPPDTDPGYYATLAARAAEHGTRFVLDTSGRALVDALASGVYLIKPNLRELRELTGAALEDDIAIREAAESLIARGAAEVVLVSLGAGGALLVTEALAERLASPTVPIRSRVGAGDSMLAGIVLGLARGWPVRRAVRLGLAAGAAAVMTPGTELCKRADVERLFALLDPTAPVSAPR